jgi:hypothetical protein
MAEYRLLNTNPAAKRVPRIPDKPVPPPASSMLAAGASDAMGVADLPEGVKMQKSFEEKMGVGEKNFDVRTQSLHEGRGFALLRPLTVCCGVMCTCDGACVYAGARRDYSHSVFREYGL